MNAITPSRVLHVSLVYAGGIQTVVEDYVRALPQLEHVVLARGNPHHRTGQVANEVRLIQGGLRGLAQEIRGYLAQAPKTVVHLHSSTAGLLRAFLPPATPIVYQPHCYAFERTDWSAVALRLVHRVEQRLARKTSVTIAVSPHEADLARGLQREMPVAYVPNVSRMQETPSPEVSPRSAVTVGRIAKQKDPRFFAETARQLRGMNVDTTWIGDGDRGLRRMLEDAGVRVTGWLPRDQAVQEMLAHDLYLHAAAWEGAPMTLVEAASHGMSVIARQIAPLSSLGYETGGENPSSLAGAVERYFSEPEYAQLVHDRTKAVLAPLTVEAQAAALMEAYSTAMAQ